MGTTVSKVYQILFTGNPAGAVAAFGSITKAGRASQTDLQKWGGIANAIFAGAALGAGAFAVHSVKTFIEFDEQMTKTTAIMGNVSDKMRGELSDAAREVGKTTKFGATEAAEAMTILASANFSAEKTMAVLPTIAQFATAGYMDLNTATNSLVDSQAALGLTTGDTAKDLENMKRITDVLTKANQLSNAEVSDFAAALQNKASGAMRAWGVDVEEGVAALAVFAERGVKGEEAGNALNIVLRDMGRAAVNNTGAWDQYGLSIFDAAGNMKPLPDIFAMMENKMGSMTDEQKTVMFDTLGLNRGVANFMRTLIGGSGHMKEYEAALREAGGTTKTVAEKAMESAKNKLQLLKNKFQDVSITVGAALVPVLLDLMTKLEELAGWLNDHVVPKLKSMWEWVNNHIVPSLASFFNLIKDNKPTMTVFSTFLAGVALSGAAASVAKLASSMAFLVKPIGVVAGLAGFLSTMFIMLTLSLLKLMAPAIAIGVIIWKMLGGWDGIKKKAAAVWSFVVDKFNWAKDKIGDILGWLIEKFFQAKDKVMEWKDKFVEILGKARDKLGDIVAWIADKWDAFKKKMGEVIDWIQDKFDIFWAWSQPFRDDIGEIWNKLVEQSSKLLEEIGETVTKIKSWFDWLYAKIQPILSTIGTQLGKFAGEVGNLLTSIGRILSSLGWVIFGVLREAGERFVWFRDIVFGVLRETIERVVWFAGQVVDKIAWFVRITEPVWSRVWVAMGAAVQAAIAVISTVVSVGMTMLRNIWDTGWKFFSTVLAPVWDAIKAVIMFIISFISNYIQFGLNIIQGDWGEAWDNIKNIIGAAWNAIAAIINAGIALTIGVLVAAWDTLKTVAIAVWGLIAGAIQSAWILFEPIFEAIGAAVNVTLVPAFQLLQSVVQTVWNAIWAAVSTAWGVIQPILSSIAGYIETVLVANFNVLYAVVSYTWRGIQLEISAVWAVIQGIWTGIQAFINTILIPEFNLLLSGVSIVWQGIQAAISTAWGIIQGIFGGLINFIDTLLSPAFSRIGSTVSFVWDGIKSGISGAWDFIRGIWNNIIDFIDNTLGAAWTRIKDGALGAFNGINDAMGGIWDKIAGAIDTGIEAGANLIDLLIDGVQKIIDILPGVNIKLPTINWGKGGGSGGSGGSNAVNSNSSAVNRQSIIEHNEASSIAGRASGLAAGGIVPNASGPTTVNRARAIVGEGNSLYPEYVIPTDPKHRDRAVDFLTQAASKLGMHIPTMAAGGIIPDNPITDAIGNVVGSLRRGGANAMFSALETTINPLINKLPWEFAQGVARKTMDALKMFVSGEDSKLPEETASAGGWGGGGLPGDGGSGKGRSRPRGPGIFGLYNDFGFADKVAAVIAQGHGQVGGWGWRSTERQAQMYYDWTHHLNGQAQAAKPGSSWHEAGLAVDFNGNGALWHRLATAQGLYRAVPGESWHYQAHGYDKGAWNIKKDHTAEVHEGEMVVPQKQADMLRNNRGMAGQSAAVVIQNLTIYANSAKEGREAYRGFTEDLERRRIMIDAKTA